MKLLAFFLCLIVCIIFLDSKIRPTIRTVASYQAKILATQMIEDAIYQQLQNTQYTYEDYIILAKREDGVVSSVETNVVTVNLVKNAITRTIIEQVKTLQTQDFSIPLGTLFGEEFLSGRGPSVRLKLYPSGAVTTKLISKFTSAGINQTQHEILLSINIPLTAVIPGCSTSIEVSSDFSIAETIIVGVVPEYYTQIIGEDQQIVDQLADYGNQEAPKEKAAD